MAGCSCRVLSIASAPPFCQSAQSSSKNCSLNLFREPLGRPAGLPLWPDSQGRRKPVRRCFCGVFSLSARFPLLFPLTAFPLSFSPTQQLRLIRSCATFRPLHNQRNIALDLVLHFLRWLAVEPVSNLPTRNCIALNSILDPAPDNIV